MKKKEDKKKIGRKWFDLTEEDIENGKTVESVIAKCREVWAMDGTNAEASTLADVSQDSISRYLKAYPKEAEIRQRLKNNPVLKARKTVVENLNDPNYAFKYLEKKKKNEFGNNLDLTSDGQPLTIKWDK